MSVRAVHESISDRNLHQTGVLAGDEAGSWLAKALADLAEQLVTVDEASLDDVVTAGLACVGEALHMDFGGLWRRLDSGTADGVQYHWVIQPHLAPSCETACAQLFARVIEGHAGVWFTRADFALHPSARRAIADQGLRAGIVLPVGPGGRGTRGALAFGSMTADESWTPSTIDHLRLAAAVIGQTLARLEAQTALQRTPDSHDHRRGESHRDPVNVRVLETPYLRDRLRAENEYLRHEFQERLGEGVIVGQSDAIRNVLEQAQQVAATDSTVLLLGETGTGKELIATHIHEQSTRRGRIMVRVNCSAIPSTLIESELFGREKGAFTGALSRQVGRFETADHSSIFLDEIGDLPAEVQVKLLRVLEQRQVERLGSPKSIPVDVRIIAATHRDLEKRIADDTFREDLFYRLNVFPIRVPPLRDRVEDIPLLVWRFVIEFAKAFGKRIESIPRENIALLQRYHWPGNIRELRNVVERAMIVANGSRLVIPLPATAPAMPGLVRIRLEDVEREHIRAVLERVRWRIRGMGGAAEQLGLRPTTLETRMAKLGLARPKTA